MKTLAESSYYFRKAALGVLRHMPRTRLAARKVYWRFQQERYEQIARNNSVDENLVFFESFFGRWYADSPKAIYEAMLQDPRFEDHIFIWSFRPDVEVDTSKFDTERTIFIKRGQQEYFQALATAKLIILNTRLPEYIYPKEDQVYVQCWHGTPLKKLGADVAIETANALNTTSELAWRFAIDSKKWTYMLSASPFVTKHLTSAFSLPEERKASVVLEVGDPGNDALVKAKNNPQITEEMRQRLGVPAGKKALLYAPTWRDDSYKAGEGYTLDYLLDFDYLHKHLSEEWVILFRPHYYIANSFDFEKYGGFVIDVSKVDDINDCMVASDVLVTDYSSVMFDYCNTGKPLLLYVPDLEHYSGDVRDFYFDIHDVPSPLCGTIQELCKELIGADHNQSIHDSEYLAFLATFCPLDDGSATERTIDFLLSARKNRVKEESDA